MPIETADTSGHKMDVPAPELPLLDPAFAKVDRGELRKEYAGKFGAFPAIPEGAKTLRVSAAGGDRTGVLTVRARRGPRRKRSPINGR